MSPWEEQHVSRDQKYRLNQTNSNHCLLSRLIDFMLVHTHFCIKREIYWIKNFTEIEIIFDYFFCPPTVQEFDEEEVISHEIQSKCPLFTLLLSKSGFFKVDAEKKSGAELGQASA